MRYIKQSTSVDVGIGPFLDETDGKTAETALTITQPDVRLKKNGGAWAQKAAAQTLSHEEAGWYEVTLDATDTDTIGHLLVAVHESGALPVWMEFHVLAANVYDSLFGAATDKLDVNVEEWNTTAVPAEHTAGYPIVTVKDGTGTGEINTNAGKVVGVELVDVLTTYTGDTPQTGDSFARIGALGAGLTAVDDAVISAIAALNNLSAAGVRTELATELARIDVATSTRMATYTQPTGFLTANFPTDPADQSLIIAATDVLVTLIGDVPTNAELATALGTADDAVLVQVALVKAKTDLIPASPAAVGSAMTLSSGAIVAATFGAGAIDAAAMAADVVNDIWMGTALTEAYAADGAAATPAQLLYMILCAVSEFAIAGTTITGKKLDGTTTAMTWTIDSSTVPTSRTRAS